MQINSVRKIKGLADMVGPFSFRVRDFGARTYCNVQRSVYLFQGRYKAILVEKNTDSQANRPFKQKIERQQDLREDVDAAVAKQQTSTLEI